MKITYLNRIFTEQGWDVYSLVELEEAEIEQARQQRTGEARLVEDWLNDRRESTMARAGDSASISMSASPHPGRPHTFIVVAEVCLAREPKA
ncbi:MAG TPA: hypothetical protein P5305_03995 [Rubrivivax sp.]|nr:hypothetical protein [Rubrivivax sp.]HRY87024.1 hypothetical protein [Rubrivivax sp.]